MYQCGDLIIVVFMCKYYYSMTIGQGRAKIAQIPLNTVQTASAVPFLLTYFTKDQLYFLHLHSTAIRFEKSFEEKV